MRTLNHHFAVWSFDDDDRPYWMTSTDVDRRYTQKMTSEDEELHDEKRAEDESIISIDILVL